MQNNLSSPSLTFKGWYSQLKDEVHSHIDVFTRNFIRRSIKGGRVSANINKFESLNINNIIDILKLHLKTEENNVVNLMEIYSKHIDDLFKLLTLHLDSDREKEEIEEIIKDYEKCIRSEDIDQSDSWKIVNNIKNNLLK